MRPGVYRRKQIVDECMRRGVVYYTARTSTNVGARAAHSFAHPPKIPELFSVGSGIVQFLGVSPRPLYAADAAVESAC
jgi:hypothetical protein